MQGRLANRGRRGGPGFTMIEALVVLAIVGLVVMFGLIGIEQTLPAWRVDTASRDIAMALRAARSKASLEGADVLMPFDTTQQRYALLTETAPGTVVESGGMTLTELPPGVSFSRPDVGDVVTFSPPAAPTEKTAVFDASGLLLSLNRPADVYVGHTDRGIYRRVRVNLVGVVSTARWNGTAWE